jgi:hypothetical protein
MDKAGYLKKLRLFLADHESKIWDDSELYTLLDEALKKYCIDSGAVTGEFDFSPDENGVFHYPDDFGKFMIGWNKDGYEINQATARELFVSSCRDSSRSGNAEYIFDDLSNYGEFALYPSPAEMQNAQSITVTPDFGEIFDDSFGVYITDDYGTTLAIDRFEYAGVVFYRKIGNYEDIKDYMAVICYALYLAYNADSDFANPEISAYWKNMYKSRLAVFGRVAHNNTGRTVSENFF